MKILTLHIFLFWAFLLFNTAFSQVSINGTSNYSVCDGSAITVNNGSWTSWNWLDSNGIVIQTGIDTLENLCNGFYTLEYIEGGITYDTTFYINLSDPCLYFSLNLNTYPPSSTTTCDGSVSANITNGTPPYTYLWNSGSIYYSIEDLCEGTYNLIVNDVNGCSSTESVILQVDSMIVACEDFITSINLTNETSVGNCNGNANITISGGTPGYTISWNTGETTTSINNLCNGLYSVLISDSNGCADSLYATIATDNPNTSCSGFIVNLSVTTESAQGTCDGSIISTVINGTPGYSYSWSNGSNNQNISGLCTGFYSLTVTDGNGCIAVASTDFSSDSTALPCNGFSMTLTTVNENYFSACNGSANITLSGGNSGYQIYWSDYSEANSISGLCSGEYFVYAQDMAGCTIYQFFEIGVDVSPNCLDFYVTITPTNEMINGACDGSALANVYGANSICAFQWSNGSQSETAENLCEGNYTVTVSDTAGCISTASTYINQGTINDSCYFLNVNITVTDESEPGACDGEAFFTISGGNPVYTYDWGNGAGTMDLADLCSGMVYLTIIDAIGCSASDSAYVGSFNPIEADVNVTNSSSETLCDGSISIDILSGLEPLYYYLSPTEDSTSTVNNLCSGFYELYIYDTLGNYFYYDFIITDPQSTISSEDFSDSIFVDTIYTNLIYSCDYDIPTIDSIWIDSYVNSSLDIITVTWGILDMNGTTYLNVDYYVPNPVGVYTFELSIFCPNKAIDQFIKAFDQIYFDDELGFHENGNTIISNITLYPNPTTGPFNLTYGNVKGQIEVDILNSKGQTINSYIFSDQSLSDFEIQADNGMYFVKVLTEKGISVFKVVKE